MQLRMTFAAYVIIVIVKNFLILPHSMLEALQILSLSLLEPIPINQIFTMISENLELQFEPQQLVLLWKTLEHR